jgi:hypothetical protein
VANELLPRKFTAAQQRQIAAWEVARRWRTLAADKIFPASVGYQLPGSALGSGHNLLLTAHRLGISGEETCSAGAAGRAGAVLSQYHCAAVLRATYSDSTGSLVATVGVDVLPGDAAARKVARALSVGRNGSGPLAVRAASVAGTVAATFRDPDRELSTTTSTGPYVISSVVGYADGRPQEPIYSEDRYVYEEMKNFAGGVTQAVSEVLGRPPHTPTCPGAPGC